MSLAIGPIVSYQESCGAVEWTRSGTGMQHRSGWCGGGRWNRYYLLVVEDAVLSAADFFWLSGVKDLAGNAV